MSDSQNNIERRILEFLSKKQTATNTAIAKEFSVEEKSVNEILNKLREEGLVQFQQELRLTRGELIMAKISPKGTTVIQSTKTESTPAQTRRSFDFDHLSSAIRFAAYAHQNEFRKGGTTPYIVHPLDVLSILLKNGAGEDLAIAGVLHDVLEDTPHSRKEIRRNFGDMVGTLVEGASESEALTKGISNEDKKKTWKLRKTERIEKVKTSGGELRLLICADKLANIRDLLVDLHSQGEDVWKKFNASKEEQEWYYREMTSAMASPKGAEADISGTSAYQELTACIREVFGVP